MMYFRRIRTSLVAVGFAVVAFMPVLVVGSATAQISEESKDAACQAIGATGQQGCDDSAGSSVAELASVVVNILSWIVGVAAIIVMIIGAMKFVTANGDSNSIASARNTIIYALVGVIVAVSAQVLVRFVLETSSSSSSGGESVNMCVVDENGAFLSNPDPTRTCAM